MPLAPLRVAAAPLALPPHARHGNHARRGRGGCGLVRPYQKRNKRACFASSSSPSPSRTQRIMERLSSGGEVGGAGGAYSYSALKRLDRILSSICAGLADSEKIPEVVTQVQGPAISYNLGDGAEIFDVLVCGGTLGIFVATALSSKGLRVGIIERNIIKGREQEWNISRKELMELVEIGILLEEEVDQIIASDFNPNRCGFENKGDIWVENILNLGISPAKLLEIVKKRFISLGGTIFEGKSLLSIFIHDDVAVLQLNDGGFLSCRLIVDSMGNFSPIVRQVRRGRKPDGVCLVVGSCSRGFNKNTTSDIIFSSSSVKRAGNSEVQLFWEAFPAGSGSTDRTTYMFTYVDPQFGVPKLEELLEEYWTLMPAYQGEFLENLEVRRVIFGIFPTYRDSPLPAAFDRILQVGDASGIQSPVSFGGFGSMTRHLGRLSNGIYEAVVGDFLDAHGLRLLNPYMKLGNSVMRPFLQDVIQFGPLVKTLGLVMLTRPQLLPSIFKQVGIGVLLDWSGHFLMLGYYTFLSVYIDPVIRPWVESLPPRSKYEWKRYLEAWKYGAGLDYRQGD